MIDGVAYIVNDIPMAQELQKMWVRFIMTDEIEKLRSALE
jgi:hypothetical protein